MKLVKNIRSKSKREEDKDRPKRSKNNINPDNTMHRWYYIFNKFFFMGLILILISVIIDLLEIDAFIISVFKNILQTVGIALMIGAVFDFSKNSKGFMDLVTGILYQIVVSKEFLVKMGKEDKRRALEFILRPSSEQLNKCGNIDDYFKKGIDSSMSMFDSDFKTNLVITAEAKKVNGKVVVSGIMTNRVYRIKDKFDPIYTTFEREDCSIVKTIIIHPEGEENPSIVENQEAGESFEGGQISKKYQLEIPEVLQKYPYLTIKREFEEIGYDHWTNFHWTSLTPCDGIVFELKCEKGLIIKDYLIFDDKKLYNVDLTQNKMNIHIISINWLNRFTGFTLTISEENTSGNEESGSGNEENEENNI